MASCSSLGTRTTAGTGRPSLGAGHPVVKKSEGIAGESRVRVAPKAVATCPFSSYDTGFNEKSISGCVSIPSSPIVQYMLSRSCIVAAHPESASSAKMSKAPLGRQFPEPFPDSHLVGRPLILWLRHLVGFFAPATHDHRRTTAQRATPSPPSATPPQPRRLRCRYARKVDIAVHSPARKRPRYNPTPPATRGQRPPVLVTRSFASSNCSPFFAPGKAVCLVPDKSG